MFVKHKTKNWVSSFFDLIFERITKQQKMTKETTILIFEKCNLCRLCINVCPYACIKQNDKKIEIDKNICVKCRLCERICPKQAIETSEEKI